LGCWLINSKPSFFLAGHSISAVISSTAYSDMIDAFSFFIDEFRDELSGFVAKNWFNFGFSQHKKTGTPPFAFHFLNFSNVPVPDSLNRGHLVFEALNGDITNMFDFFDHEF